MKFGTATVFCLLAFFMFVSMAVVDQPVAAAIYWAVATWLMVERIVD